MDKQEILVTVVCTTFNQQDYIADALESFVVQKTDFAFEIIVHDDASTDKTQDIIKDYHRRYPHLIKPILQIENQYCQGAFKPIPHAASFAKGRYLALCEGDDYWTDNGKLQLQLDSMRRHPSCNLCFHPAAAVSSDGGREVVCDYSRSERIFDVETIIRGEGGFCPTPSLMVKKSVIDALPDWFYRDAPVGDYYIQVLASVPHGALYIPQPMAAYRVMALGSWSALNMRNARRMSQILQRKIDLCDVINEYLYKRYSSAFKFMRSSYLIEQCLLLFRIGENAKAIKSTVSLMKNPSYMVYTMGYMAVKILKNPKKGIERITRYFSVKA